MDESEETTDSREPIRLVLDTGRREPGQLLEHLERSTADSVDQIFVRIDDPASASAVAVLEALVTTDPAAPVTIRLSTPEDPRALENALRGLQPHQLILDADGPFERALDVLRPLLGEETKIHTEWVLSPENWFDLRTVARRVTGLGLQLRLRALDDRGEFPLGACDAPRLTAVLDHLAATWDWFGEEHRPASLEPEAHQELRQALYLAVIDREPTSDPAPLAIPAPDHELWSTASTAIALTSPMMSLGEASEVQAFVTDRLLAELSDEQLRERPWFRLLLQKVIREVPNPELRDRIVGLYREDPRTLFETEDEFAELAHLTWLTRSRAEWLDEKQLAPRSAPFETPRKAAPESPPESPRVTVLVPSYRHSQFIEECLESVLGQTLEDFRLLVVDDRSPDDTAERATRFDDPRVEVRVNEENLGLGNSVLQALESIDTPYVALLNSDDLFHPDRLAACVEALENDPKALLVATGLHLVDETGGEMTTDNVGRLTDAPRIRDWIHWYQGAQPEISDPELLFGELLQHNFLATSTNLVCRTDFLRAQAQALRSLKYCLDWWMFLEAAAEHGLRYLPERLASYRLHRNNTVWFGGGTRWTYYLEVNRVATKALRSALEHAKAEGADPIERILRLAIDHLSHNTEIDGLGIVCNLLLGGLALDEASQTSEEIERRVRSLHEAAERRLRIHYATQDLQTDEELERLDDLTEAGELQEQKLTVRAARDRIEFLEDTAAWNERATRAVRAELQATWAKVSELREQIHRDASEIEQLDKAQAEVREQLEAVNRGLPEDDQLGPVEPTDTRIQAVWSDVRRAAELARAWGQRQSELLELLRDDRSEIEQKRAEIDRKQGEIDAARAEIERVHEELERSIETRESLRSSLDQLTEGLERSFARAESQRLQHEADLRRLRADHEEALTAAQEEAAEAREQGRNQTAEARQETAEARQETAEARQETAEARQEAAEARQEAAEARQEAAEARQEAAEAREKGRQQTAEAREETAAVRQRLQDLRSELQSTRTTLRQTERELHRVRTSRELRLGNLIWNKTPLFAKTRRFIKTRLKRFAETRTRTMIFLKKLFRSRSPESPIQVMAGSTSTFPVISHTFVYQELSAMHSMMGADVTLLHTQEGDRAALHAAFRYLDENRQFVTPNWEAHTGDFEHFRKTRPEKVESLLEALHQESGLPREDIENRFELRMAFTYARRAEAMGAQYVHSYFFYDQALCALVTSWLLDLPRGLSTYADHMMDDWPLKVVPLHLRNADVIVATSKRIRDELVGIGGEGIAHKVIVKPNGVNGERFPVVPRTAPQGRPLHLICMTRIEPKKGMLELADAVKSVKDRGVNVRVHIIGSPDAGVEASENYAALLDSKIAEHGIQDELILHGRMLQEDMKPLIDQADCFVAPFVETESGDKDGIPTAILEGMSSGLPVIGTTAGSIPEIFDDGVEGYIVPQKDAAALADAIAKMASDPARVLEMGVAARKRFDAEFDIKATEPRLHERIKKALAEKKSAVNA